MTSKKRIFGVLSTILSIAGTLMLIISYSISTNPTSSELVIIKSLFFSALGSLVISIVLGFIGILTGERGFLIFTGILIVFVMVVGLLVVFLSMAFLGFREP
ncbi:MULTISPECIES: hypothetical protein [unclassified Paenibacillus]|uniref:hypothetical protein n=1 Tax=unclassified Paenibacillus TaxID=185978 RepID=UPI00034EBE7C|nr:MULTISPECIES: hypothetical protein [unclassified Paenibacillus]EPD88329.1 hypothetical protein HMPREF1207_02503 [Paenibacillus sp. HGH0039]